MSGTLALSAAIAAMDLGALTALVQLRRPQSISSIADPIGLAVELLRADSIERAIRVLERSDLAALVDPERASAAQSARLIGSGLLGISDTSASAPPGTPVALAEVRAVLTASLERVDISLTDILHNREGSTASPSETSDTSAPASWYVPALTAVGVAAETLRGLGTRPGGMNRSGAVAVATVKALAESSGIPQSEVSCSIEAMMAAGLLGTPQRDPRLVWSGRAAAWLDMPSPERWVALASAVATHMPSQLRLLVQGADMNAALAALPSRFPLLPPATTAGIARFAQLAEHLGLTVGGVLSEAGRSLISPGAAPASAAPQEAGGLPDVDAALQLARRDMPAPSPGVYIQPDLSIIVPGPLAPSDEAVLTSFSVPEQTGIASTRRITEASLTDALERGFNADAARAALERLSLTGIPQPLDYMLTSLAARIRSIVVHEHDGEAGRTRLEIARAELRDTLLVDRALHHLQLSPGGDSADAGLGPTMLYSKLRSEHVLAALSDARYTASAAGRSDTAPLIAEPPLAPAELPEELTDLVARVHHAAASGPGEGGFTRRLELAIKDRSTVRVTASALGRTHVFTLLPISLSAGRLRATDQGAGVERTLPVSTITAVE